MAETPMARPSSMKIAFDDGMIRGGPAPRNDEVVARLLSRAPDRLLRGEKSNSVLLLSPATVIG